MTEPTGPNPFADDTLPRRPGVSGANPFADDPRAAPGAAPERTWWDTAKDVGQTLDDTARAAASSMTLGNADRVAGAGDYLTGAGYPRNLSDLVAGKNGPSYDEAVNAQVKLSEEARKRSPIASVVGDVLGAIALPGIGGRQLAARYGGGIGARMLGYGGEGAVLGGLAGAGNTYTGKPMDYLSNAGWGAAIGAPLGAGMGAIFGPAGGLVSKAKTPDAATQGAARDIAYDTFRALPAQYTPASFASAGQDARVALRQKGHYDAPTTEGGSPVPFRAVDQMQAPPTAVNPVTGANTHISPGDIDIVRRGTTGERISGLDPWQQSGAGIVRRRIDDFVTNPPPGSVVPGTEGAARQAGHIYQTARDLHGGTMRTEAIDELIRNAERQTGSTHSGLNLRNELQKFVKTGLKEKQGESTFSRAGFNDAELAAFDKFSRGQGTVSNALGYVDKYLGGGGGLGALAAGAAGGQYLGNEDNGLMKGLGVTGLGLGLRMLGNRRAANDINQLRDLISQRNPLYAQRAANARTTVPGSSATQRVRNAITNEVIQQGVGQTGFEDEPRLRLTVNPDYGTR